MNVMKEKFAEKLKQLRRQDTIVVECATYDETVLFLDEYNKWFDKHPWCSSVDGKRSVDLRFDRNGYVGFNYHDNSDYRSEQEEYGIVEFISVSDLMGGTPLEEEDIDIATIM